MCECECGCHDSQAACSPCCADIIKEKNKLMSYPNPSRLLFERVEKLENHICFNKDNRHDLNLALSDIQNDYKDRFEILEDKCVTEFEIIKGFNEETQKSFNRLSERIDVLENCDRGNLDLINHCQRGIEKCFERIEKLNSEMNVFLSRLIQAEDSIKEMLGQKFSEFHHLTPRVEKLERWKEAAIEKNIEDVERMRELERF
jgi:hypothetical protein